MAAAATGQNSRRVEIRPLSFSQISLYQSCPLQYRLRYLDGLKPKVKSYFSFGTTIHACVEYFFRVEAPPPPSLEKLLEFYDQNWLSEGYASAEEEAGYRQYGKEILTRFYEIHAPNFRLPVALERNFSVEIDGVRLQGIIDRVDKLDSGGLAIIDYKTNKELFTTQHLEQDLQLTIYQMAAERTWGLPVEKLTLYHLRSNTACSCPPRPPEQLDQARQVIIDVAERIARGEFPARENEFCPCDFPEYCPYFRHRYLKAIPQEPRQEQLPGFFAAEAVDQYIEVRNRIAELEAQLEELKAKIIRYCQDEGLNRVFGSSGEVTYKMIEKTGFDEDEVRSLLEPAGLWPSVLGLDEKRLQKLLADASVDKALKEKLASLRHTITTYVQLRLRRYRNETDEAE